MKAAPKSRRTLGLAMIMKDEVEDLDRIVKDYGRFFDKIYVTVTDRKTYTALRKRFPAKSATTGPVELSYFKWIDHFGKARIYNQRQVKTDYWMWIDLDDEIEGAEKLPLVLELMITNDLDMVWFQYDYIQRVNFSDPGSISWRERIIRTASTLAWRDEAVHETIDETVHGDIKHVLIWEAMIKHRQTAEHSLVSGERNRLILEKEWQRTHRAVTAHYQGTYLIIIGDYVGAIEKLSYVTKHSESEEQRFEAWNHLSGCYFETGNYMAALDATNECLNIHPDHPAPWYQKFSVYRAMGDHAAAMQSAEIAMGKHMQGVLTSTTHDQSWYQYKGPFAVAQAYLSLGNVERAYQLYSMVKEIAPEYVEEVSTAEGIQWSDIFEQ
jgi:tetratricopeptide (TPR) repeat protein